VCDRCFAGAVVDCERVGLGDDCGGGEDYAAAGWDCKGSFLALILLMVLGVVVVLLRL
jgi:hypothetical protein